MRKDKETTATEHASYRLRAAIVVSMSALIILLIVAGGWIWQAHQKSVSPAPDISKVREIVGDLPKGYSVHAGRNVLAASQIADMKKPLAGLVTPGKCAALSASAVDNLLGATLESVDAFRPGMTYLVSAEEIPADHPGHRPLSADCDYTTSATSDGSSISTRQDAPAVTGVDPADVTVSRTVTTSATGTEDSYSYTAWIDGHHAVILQVRATPQAGQPLLRINTDEATELFRKAVRLVAQP